MTGTSQQTTDDISIHGNIKFSKKLSWKDVMYIALLLANFGKGYFIPTPTMHDIQDLQGKYGTLSTEFMNMKGAVNRIEARQIGVSPSDVDEFNEYMREKRKNNL